MSTRALYTFKGDTAAESWNVYKHHDGYPTGAASTLADAQKYFAWKLPRYEADEFAASFCAAGKADHYLEALTAKSPKDRKAALRFTAIGEYKTQGGGVRFMPQGEPLAVACTNCSDIEYRYEIYAGNSGELRIRAYSVDAWGDKPSETLLTDCALAAFVDWAEAHEKAEAAS